MELVKLHDLEPHTYINHNGNIIGKQDAEALISAGLHPKLYTVSDEWIHQSLFDASRQLKNKDDISSEYSAPDHYARQIVY